MSERSERAGVPWVATILVVAFAMGLGWYIGSRLGADADEAADRPHNAQQRRAGSVGDGEVYRDVAGRVVRIDREQGVFTVDHEEIEGFMRAMVMDLNLADPAELQGLEAGDEILFDLARIGDTYKAVRIRRVGDEGAVQPPGAAVEPPADPLGPGDLVPDLALVDAHGRRFNLRELQPRHKVVTFFYARCPLEHFCPAQSQRLAMLQRHLRESGSEVHLVSLTLDAEHDGQQILAGYAEQFEADPNHWTLARSDDADAIREFAHRAGAQVHARSDSYEIDHTLIALRVDGDRIVDRVYGLDAIERLVQAM